jgi:hypothetical protein
MNPALTQPHTFPLDELPAELAHFAAESAAHYGKN